MSKRLEYRQAIALCVVWIIYMVLWSTPTVRTFVPCLHPINTAVIVAILIAAVATIAGHIGGNKKIKNIGIISVIVITFSIDILAIFVLTGLIPTCI